MARQNPELKSALGKYANAHHTNDPEQIQKARMRWALLKAKDLRDQADSIILDAATGHTSDAPR